MKSYILSEKSLFKKISPKYLFGAFLGALGDGYLIYWFPEINIIAPLYFELCCRAITRFTDTLYGNKTTNTEEEEYLNNITL